MSFNIHGLTKKKITQSLLIKSTILIIFINGIFVHLANITLVIYLMVCEDPHEVVEPSKMRIIEKSLNYSSHAESYGIFK